MRCLAVAALMLPLLSSVADASEFRCGNEFITFPIERKGKNSAEIITIPRSKLLTVIVLRETKLDAFRRKNPQYNDMDDETLAKSLYHKHYSNMPFERYIEMVGAEVKEVRVGIGGVSHPISNKTRQRIIQCLD